MTRFPFYAPDRREFFETYAAEYRFDRDEPTPWMPLRQDLRSSKIAVITTSGVRSTATPAFGVDRARGCAQFRELTIHRLASGFAFDYAAYGTDEALKDLNVLVPVDPVIDLAERRLVREVSERMYSFVGLCENLEALRASAAEVAGRMREDEVDAALVFTAGHVCNQTAGIIARELEKRAVSTVCLITLREVAQEIKIPRSAFINFPFGRLLGRAFDRPLQESIVGDMLRALRSLDKPGRIVELPYRWALQ